MATSYTRTSLSAPANVNVNLYCGQCESQLGIFDNEWIRLTPSYARSKEKGTHFGTEVGNRTQIVPSGPAKRSAEGCVMAEVFCRKCSNMVGQYCKNVPDAEKQPLLDQYFYKLSRTFLKDSRTMARVDPGFSYDSDSVKSVRSRSSTAPRGSLLPGSRWADTPLRQSSRTPVSSLAGAPPESKRQGSQGLRTTTIQPTAERWEQSMAEVQRWKAELASQRSLIEQQSETLSIQNQRLDDQETRLLEHETTIEDHESCLSAQATRIVEQGELIKDQTSCLQEQHLQMSNITAQLVKLQKTMNELVSTLHKSGQVSVVQISTQTENAGNDNIAESLTTGLEDAKSNTEGLQNLRAEDKDVDLSSSTAASAMDATSDVVHSQDTHIETSQSTVSKTHQVLGKRRRITTGWPSLSPDDSFAAPGDAPEHPRTSTEQMPTPQSSDGVQHSPEQTPTTATTRAAGSHQEEARTREEHHDGIENSIVLDEARALDADVDEPPVAVKRKRGRPLKKRRAAPIITAPTKSVELDSDFQATESPRSGQRVTRAATRTARQKEVDTEEEHAGVQISTILSSPAPDVDMMHPRELLHESLQGHTQTIQMASSVLGMNLEALVASSRALRQSIGPRDTPTSSRTDSIVPATNSSDMFTKRTPVMETPVEEFDDGNMEIDKRTDVAADDYGKIEFVQDVEVYDMLDASDDDDDDLMQVDKTLFGEDPSDNESVGLFGSDYDDADEVDGVDRSCLVPREDRSMAPEPFKCKAITVGVIRKPITLDNMHLITPRMFEMAYAAGRVPKAVRPPVVPTREQALNQELRQLGLSKWIGKSKTCREYRQAVDAARTRVRNLNKVAFLRSRGLNYDPAELYSILPEGSDEASDTDASTTDMEDIENTLSSTGNASTSALLEFVNMIHNPNAEDGKGMVLEQPRATRASRKQTRALLLSGLEAINGRVATKKRSTNPRRVYQLRPDTDPIEQQARLLAAQKELDMPLPLAAQTDPVVDLPVVGDKSLQKVDLTEPEADGVDHEPLLQVVDPGRQEADIVGDESLHDADPARQEADLAKQETAPTKHNAGPAKRKPSTRTGSRRRQRQRQSVVPEPQIMASDDSIKGHDSRVAIGRLTPTLVRQAPATPSAKSLPGNTADRMREALSPFSILLRDRMAKDLMEREDMDT